MKANIRSCLVLFITGFISVIPAVAGNIIMVARPSLKVLEVRLANSDEIYSILFTLRASGDIALENIERGIRTSDQRWIIESHKPDDSTINVLILNRDLKCLNKGSGTLVFIPFIFKNSSARSHVCLSRIMITDRNADSLGFTTANIEWENSADFFSNADDSRTLQLCQNFPNPFNLRTKITYRLNKEERVKLIIYTITGMEISRLIDRTQSAGEYEVDWNGDADNGRSLASGIYIARLSAGSEFLSLKMILTK